MLYGLQTLGEKSEIECRCRRRTNSLARGHLQCRLRINTRTIRVWPIWGWTVLHTHAHTCLRIGAIVFDFIPPAARVGGGARV